MANSLKGSTPHQFTEKSSSGTALIGLNFHTPALGGRYPPAVAACNVLIDATGNLRLFKTKGYLNGPMTLVNTTGNALTVEVWDGDPGNSASIMITRLQAAANVDTERTFAAPWVWKRSLWIKVAGSSPGGRLCFGAAY